MPNGLFGLQSFHPESWHTSTLRTARLWQLGAAALRSLVERHAAHLRQKATMQKRSPPPARQPACSTDAKQGETVQCGRLSEQTAVPAAPLTATQQQQLPGAAAKDATGPRQHASRHSRTERSRLQTRRRRCHARAPGSNRLSRRGESARDVHTAPRTERACATAGGASCLRRGEHLGPLAALPELRIARMASARAVRAAFMASSSVPGKLQRLPDRMH